MVAVGCDFSRLQLVLNEEDTNVRRHGPLCTLHVT